MHRWCTTICKTLILGACHLHSKLDMWSHLHELLSAEEDLYEICHKQVPDILPRMY